MKFRIQGDSDIKRIKNVSINGFNLYCKLIADAVNTTPVGVNLNKVRIKAVLYQAGAEQTIVNSTLAPLHMDYHTTAERGGLQTQEPTTAGVLAGVVNTALDTAVKGVNTALTPIRFTGGIILKGSDYIEVEINVASDAFDTNCDADSYYTLEPNEVETTQLYIPTIQVYPINQNISSFTEVLGDNIQAISLISQDALAVDTSTPFTNIKVSTNKLSYERTSSEMYSLRENRHASETSREHASMLVIKGNDFDDVEIDVTLDSTLVTNGLCHVVVKGYEMDFDVYKSGSSRMFKQATRNRKKFSPRG